jgi:hypothetical protein
VIHGDVTFAQTQATARLTQSCKLISDINNPNKDVKLSFHAIVATVNGTVHRSALDFFSAVITADTDSLFKNREDTLRAKTRDMILRCAYRRLQRIPTPPEDPVPGPQCTTTVHRRRARETSRRTVLMFIL